MRWALLLAAQVGCSVPLETFTGPGDAIADASGDDGRPTEAPLGAPSPTTADRFGANLALSADGQVLIVGAPMRRAAFVFTRSQGAWVLGGELPSSGDPGFGASVAASGDGAWLAVGAPASGGSGSVHVFRRDEASWLLDQQIIPVAKLERSFGITVALSGEGMVLAVGATGNEVSPGGGVYLFDGPTWAPAEIAAVNLDSNDNFGNAISLAANASLVVGVAQEDGCTRTMPDNNGCMDAGAVYDYPPDHSAPTYLKADVPEAAALYGTRVALSSDASVLAVTSRGLGVVHLIDRSEPSTTMQHALAGPPGNLYGDCIALVADGSAIVIGAPASDELGANVGSVRRFRRVDASWEMAGAVLHPRDPTPGSQFGTSCAISSDGSLVVVGAPGANGGAGLVFTFSD